MDADRLTLAQFPNYWKEVLLCFWVFAGAPVPWSILPATGLFSKLPRACTAAHSACDLLSFPLFFPFGHSTETAPLELLMVCLWQNLEGSLPFLFHLTYQLLLIQWIVLCSFLASAHIDFLTLFSKVRSSFYDVLTAIHYTFFYFLTLYFASFLASSCGTCHTLNLIWNNFFNVLMLRWRALTAQCARWCGKVYI